MKTHNHPQGSEAWHAHRATCFNASDAGAMLGCSPFKTRAGLLTEYATGLRPQHDPAAQRRFGDGHRFESLAQPRAEAKIGDELAPVVGSAEFGLSRPLGASFDGLTMLGDVAWEHKTINDELRSCMTDEGNGYGLPKHYRAQLEQQMLVSGAERVLFMASKWTPSGELVEERFCWYASDPALRAEILAGWRQFDADLATFEPQPQAEKITAAPVESLPAISARIEGSLSVHSNLDAFGKALRAFIDRIPAKPETDQQFADADAACKALKKAEEALDGAEANALGQVQTVETLTRTIADLRNVARTARLASEKLVKARKDQIRVEECQRGRRAVDEHVQNLNDQLGAAYMPAIAADFGAAISGKKTLDSLRATVDQLIADKKIEANEIAGRITMNLRTIKAHGDYEFLFADLKNIVTKQPDDFQALVQSRVLAHQAEEKRRAEAAAERERDRIRQEEADKLRREQEAAVRAQVPSPSPAPAHAANDAPARSEQATAVIPITRPATRGKPTLRLGEINDRIAPLAITEAGLAKLGFPAAARERSACMYHECDLPAMLDSTIAHLRTVQQRATEAQAA